MTAAPESTSTRKVHQEPHVPRPLPVWMQVGVVVLLMVQGVQTVIHWSQAHASAASHVQAAPLAQFEYFYQPDHLGAVRAQADPQARYDYDPYGRAAATQQPANQFAGYYAHASGTVSVTQMKAYAASAGRWTERDPAP